MPGAMPPYHPLVRTGNLSDCATKTLEHCFSLACQPSGEEPPAASSYLVAFPNRPVGKQGEPGPAGMECWQ